MISLNECTPDNVRSTCEDMGFALDGKVLDSLVSYLLLLVKWNRVMNLVGPSHWRDILRSLVVDSLHLAEFAAALPLPENPECWDLGAGAGLPGIPLRMLWQKGWYTLVEAREKRAIFLQTVLASCPLPGVGVFRGRAEGFMTGRAPADLVLSRAFLPWEKVLDLTEKHIASGGYCVFLTLEPQPAHLPRGWTLAALKRYTVARDSRFFWALQRA